MSQTDDNGGLGLPCVQLIQVHSLTLHVALWTLLGVFPDSRTMYKSWASPGVVEKQNQKLKLEKKMILSIDTSEYILKKLRAFRNIYVYI